MLEEITITVDVAEQGVLADIGELLGRQGVNIESLSASTHKGAGVLHLIVDDGEEAAEALASNGYNVETERKVLTVTLDDRPGELGRYCRRLAQAGIGISAAYVARRSGGETELIPCGRRPRRGPQGLTPARRSPPQDGRAPCDPWLRRWRAVPPSPLRCQSRGSPRRTQGATAGRR